MSVASCEAPTSSGRARIASRIRGGVRVSSSAAPLKRPRERRHAAAVHRGLAAADHLGDPLLQRVQRIAIRMQRPAVRRARGEHAGVLAGAVVAEPSLGPALLQPVLEIVDAGPGAGEHLSHGLELGGLGVVRGAGDRDLVVVEVVVALDERDRLNRLRAGAQKDPQLVAPALAVRGGDVHAMHRLDDVSRAGRLP